MFGIVSRRTRERNFYAVGMQEVSMRSFPSAIDKPMLFQIGNELPDFAGHIESIIGKAKLQNTTRSLRNSRSTAWADCHAGMPFTVRLRSSAQAKELPSIWRTEIPRLRDARGVAISNRLSAP